MTKFWFLVYVVVQKTGPRSGSVLPTNVALAGIHPLIWLSGPSESFREYYVSYALWFDEIDEATFNEVKTRKYISTEDWR